MKGRLNNPMREDMLKALLAHAYRARQEALDAESIELRNAAIRQLLKPAEIKAMETLLPLLGKGEYGYNHNVYWSERVAVNCGGPKVTLCLFDSDRAYEPLEGSIPVLRVLGELRLDLPADDELAKRVQDWADRREALRSEMKVSKEQIRAALAAFSTVSQMQASWPEVLPVVQDILTEHLGRPAPSLPAVVIQEMNAKLGLPPSNDDAEQVAKAA